jgi:hypothetical protein
MELKNVRIADGVGYQRITTGNTMAVCGIIGERAAEPICQTYRI